jgi:hypothetical protein
VQLASWCAEWIQHIFLCLRLHCALNLACVLSLCVLCLLRCLVLQVTPVQAQALSATYSSWREVRHHLERCSGIKVEECPVCHGGDCVHSAHADGNLKLDVVDLSQNNYASRYEDLPGSLAVPVRQVLADFGWGCLPSGPRAGAWLRTQRAHTPRARVDGSMHHIG